MGNQLTVVWHLEDEQFSRAFFLCGWWFEELPFWLIFHMPSITYSRNCFARLCLYCPHYNIFTLILQRKAQKIVCPSTMKKCPPLSIHELKLQPRWVNFLPSSRNIRIWKWFNIMSIARTRFEFNIPQHSTPSELSPLRGWKDRRGTVHDPSRLCVPISTIWR